MFARGDPRIFGFRQMVPGDAWRLLSFGIPESERAARHQLRRRLTAIGCGSDFPVVVGDRRPGDPATRVASSEKAHRVLGWNRSSGVTHVTSDRVMFQRSAVSRGHD
ncbi:hypothetical protein ACWEO2_39115 [Nocardia sp. NPDC004278]